MNAQEKLELISEILKDNADKNVYPWMKSKDYLGTYFYQKPCGLVRMTCVGEHRLMVYLNFEDILGLHNAYFHDDEIDCAIAGTSVMDMVKDFAENCRDDHKAMKEWALIFREAADYLDECGTHPVQEQNGTHK